VTYNVAVIGTGEQEGGGEDSGFAMGYMHGTAYTEHPKCSLVGAADVVPEYANQFAEHFGFDPAGAYEDHRELLREVDLDVVSVTTPIHTHADIVMDVLRHGDVEAIHCEKPMANTWAECRLMAQEAWRRDVQLTFNHQLRFADPVQRAKTLLDDGEIGALQRVEMSRGDFFEAGSHQIDLCAHFTDDASVNWALGQVHYPERTIRHGTHVTDQTIATWEYDTGVSALAATGDGSDLVGVLNRLVGTDGVIEIDWEDSRIRRDGEGWESLEAPIDDPLSDAIAHVVECLETDTEALVSARRVLGSTEVAYGVWESVRRRGRVEFPVTVEDNPLADLLESGRLGE
jgi:predicted dehydrogenase